MAYQMALLITMPPFLKVFTSSSVGNEVLEGPTPAMQLILRSLFYAAYSMTRLASIYRESHTFRQVNPVIIHHLLSASIVHMMNSTASSFPLRRRGTRLLRQSLELFSELGKKWPIRVNKSMEMIEVLAHRWGCSSSLTRQHQHSSPPQDAKGKSDDNQQINDTVDDRSLFTNNNDGQFYGQNVYLAELGAPDLQYFGDFEFGVPADDAGGEPVDVFKAFEELNSSSDFGWLFGN